MEIRPDADADAGRPHASDADDARAELRPFPSAESRPEIHTLPARLLESHARGLLRPVLAADPPWGVGAGIAVWVASVLLLFVVPSIGIVLYLLARSGGADALRQAAALGGDPNLVVVGVAATLPAHLLTLAVVWLVTTRAGRRPFREAISWGGLSLGRAALWAAGAAAIWGAVQGVVSLIVNFTGAGETDLDALIKSSPQARVAVAALAVLTAPLVEETVYRGVLYPAFRRALGAAWAVAIVAGLFAAVHFAQYAENPGLIVGVTLLSLVLTVVRERTNSLAPCFVIHLVFNAITAAALLFAPEITETAPKPPATPAALVQSEKLKVQS